MLRPQIERKRLFLVVLSSIHSLNVRCRSMEKTNTKTQVSEMTARRITELFSEHQQDIFKSTDHMFAVLMTLQWLGGIAAAFWISPRTWIGSTSQTHVHVWAALIL